MRVVDGYGLQPLRQRIAGHREGQQQNQGAGQFLRRLKKQNVAAGGLAMAREKRIVEAGAPIGA